MDITYLGHSSFKLRGKTGTVVTDPYDSSVGFKFPNTSADIITVSHAHADHNRVDQIIPTARRPKPFIINAPGEYEMLEISVFGYPSFHDNDTGASRGSNIIMVINVDGVTTAHLGDLGHELSPQTIAAMGVVHVLLVPVGGVYTIDAKQAHGVIEAIEPQIVVPMHYKTAQHAAQFAGLSGVDIFLKEMGKEGIEAKEKLTVTHESLPSEMEIVVLKSS